MRVAFATVQAQSMHADAQASQPATAIAMEMSSMLSGSAAAHALRMQTTMVFAITKTLASARSMPVEFAMVLELSTPAAVRRFLPVPATAMEMSSMHAATAAEREWIRMETASATRKRFRAARIRRTPDTIRKQRMTMVRASWVAARFLPPATTTRPSIT